MNVTLRRHILCEHFLMVFNILIVVTQYSEMGTCSVETKLILARNVKYEERSELMR